MRASGIDDFLGLCRRFGHVRDVAVERLARLAEEHDAPAVQHQPARRERFHGRQIVAHEQNGAAGFRHLRHFPDAFLLKADIADGEHLVDHQNIQLEMRRDGERQPHEHAAAVAFDRSVEKFLGPGKGDDFVETPPDVGFAHPQYCAVEKDIFPTGEFGMKAGADFQKAGDASENPHAPARWLGNPAEDFEQGALAGAVAPDNAEHLAPADVEADILERPIFLDLVARHELSALQQVEGLAREGARPAADRIAQRGIALARRRPMADQIALGQILGGDDDFGHAASLFKSGPRRTFPSF